MVGLERFLPLGKWFGETDYVSLPSDKTIIAWCVCVRHRSHTEKPRQHTRAQNLEGKYTKELFLPPLTPNSNDIQTTTKIQGKYGGYNIK